jgi:predicted deacylase
MIMTHSIELSSAEFAAPRAGPNLLITGGVHGDEFEPMAAIRRLIADFRDDTREPSLKCGTVTLVPVVNEAAFQRGHRTADDGLDLARACPGRSDGSVTEKTAHALAELIQAADYYIDLHTGGTEFSVMPMTGYSLHANPQVLDRQRQMARAFNLPIVWGTSPSLDGRSLSVARDANVPAIYAEYHGGATYDPRGVDAYVEGCLNVLRLLEMLDWPERTSRVERVVEDPRPESGHMQICNVSPISGFFEPAVALGEAIDVGELFGSVTDSLGETVRDVRSQQRGIVLVLRTFPRVLEGQSLGVILETS